MKKSKSAGTKPAVKPAGKLAEKKAGLISAGKIFISDGVRIPFYFSRSTTGPGAGKKSLVLSFGGLNVKLAVVEKGETKFELKQAGKNFRILKGGRPFLEDVTATPTLLHAPAQAFVNLDSRCVYGCKFCSSPLLEKHFLKDYQDEKIVDMIVEASRKKEFESVAVTSGVADSPEKTVRRMVGIVRQVREKLGQKVPIGVEPYVTDKKQVEELHRAGATEIKINVQAYDRRIFRKVCPNLDYDKILEMLGYAAEIFGRNRVCSNIIIGFGESDRSVLEGVESLAKMGVVATIRAVRIDVYNYPRLKEALGIEPEPVKPDRLLRLAGEQRKILEKYGLSTKVFRTMCHRCRSCDIVPEQDIP